MTIMYEKKMLNGGFIQEIELSNGEIIIELLTHDYGNGKFDSIYLLVIEVIGENKDLGTMFIDGYNVSTSILNDEFNEILNFCENI